MFRDPYFLDFLGLKDTFSERDLESAILRESPSTSRWRRTTGESRRRSPFATGSRSLASSDYFLLPSSPLSCSIIQVSRPVIQPSSKGASDGRKSPSNIVR